MKIDREIDFHGFTRTEMRSWLDSVWARREWHGLQRVRIIHGTGETLWKDLRRWADEKNIPWTVEVSNPGVTILHPSMRPVTSPFPPHRPLSQLRHHSSLKTSSSINKPSQLSSTQSKRNTPNTNPFAPRESKQEAARLFDAELERLDEEEPGHTKRRKYR